MRYEEGLFASFVLAFVGWMLGEFQEGAYEPPAGRPRPGGAHLRSRRQANRLRAAYRIHAMAVTAKTGRDSTNSVIRIP